MDDFKISYRGQFAVLYPENEKAREWLQSNMRHTIGRQERWFDDGILLDKEIVHTVINRIMADYLLVGK